MFNKLLYPTDFSDHSKKVIPFIKKLKETGTKEVIILHVIDTNHDSLIKTFTMLTESMKHQLEIDFVKDVSEAADKKIKEVMDELGNDFEIKIIIDKGVPFKKIIEIADNENVSAIVMCSHGASDIQEIVLGSVTDKVIRKSKQPCLIIKR